MALVRNLSSTKQPTSGLSVKEGSGVFIPKKNVISQPVPDVPRKVEEQEYIEQEIINNPNKYDIIKDSSGQIIQIKEKKIETMRSGKNIKQVREEYNPYIYEFQKGKLTKIIQNKVKYESPKNGLYFGQVEKIKETLFDYDAGTKTIKDDSEVVNAKYDNWNMAYADANRRKESKESFVIVDNKGSGQVKIQDVKGNLRDPTKDEVSQALSFAKSNVNNSFTSRVFSGSSKIESEVFNPAEVLIKSKGFTTINPKVVNVFRDDKGIIGFTDNVAQKSFLAPTDARYREKDITLLQLGSTLNERTRKEQEQSLKTSKIVENILSVKTEKIEPTPFKDKVLNFLSDRGETIKNIFTEKTSDNLDIPIPLRESTKENKTKGFNIDDYGGVFGKINKKIDEGIDWVGNQYQKYNDFVFNALSRNLPSTTIKIGSAFVIPSQSEFRQSQLNAEKLFKPTLNVASYSVPYVGTGRMGVDVASAGVSLTDKDTYSAIKDDPLNAGIQYGVRALEAGLLIKGGYNKFFSKEAKINKEINKVLKELNDINKGYVKVKFTHISTPDVSKTSNYNMLTKIKENVKSSEPFYKVIGRGESKNLLFQDVINTKTNTMTRLIKSKINPKIKIKLSTDIDTGKIDILYNNKLFSSNMFKLPDTTNKLITGRVNVKQNTLLSNKLFNKASATQRQVILNDNLKSKVFFRTDLKQSTTIQKNQRLLDYMTISKKSGIKNILETKQVIKQDLLIGNPENRPDKLFFNIFERNNKIVYGFDGGIIRQPRLKTSIQTTGTFRIQTENILIPRPPTFKEQLFFNNKYLFATSVPYPNFKQSIGTRFNIRGVVSVPVANPKISVQMSDLALQSAKKSIDLTQGFKDLKLLNDVNTNNLLSSLNKVRIDNDLLNPASEKTKIDNLIVNKSVEQTYINNLSRENYDFLSRARENILYEEAIKTNPNNKTRTLTDNPSVSKVYTSVASITGVNSINIPNVNTNFKFPVIPVPDVPNIKIPVFNPNINFNLNDDKKKKRRKYKRISGVYTNPVPDAFKKFKGDFNIKFKGFKI